jgi:hypothetical protein
MSVLAFTRLAALAALVLTGGAVAVALVRADALAVDLSGLSGLGLCL